MGPRPRATPRPKLDLVAGAGRRVLLDPVELHRNPDVPMAVWEKLEEIPSVSIPKRDK